MTVSALDWILPEQDDKKLDMGAPAANAAKVPTPAVLKKSLRL
jgi:hypothetical protein